MTVDRAAARLVAEDPESGRIGTGAGRVRAARYELELLGACFRIGLPAGDVAAHELVGVFRCGNYPARGPCPACGEEFGAVFGRARVVAVVPVHERPRKFGI